MLRTNPAVREAIVLAGGFGTRLKSITGDLPKPMVEISGKPFLAWLLEYLHSQQVSSAVLSVCYNWKTISDYFSSSYYDIHLEYSVEDEPLGTGGAILQSFEQIRGDRAFVLNGDTFFPVELAKMLREHEKSSALVSIALKRMTDSDRYGLVDVDKDKKVVAFREKGVSGEGLINGGTYLIDREFIGNIPSGRAISFEKDILSSVCGSTHINGYESDSFLVDIGVPEDYAKAREYFESINT